MRPYSTVEYRPEVLDRKLLPGENDYDLSLAAKQARESFVAAGVMKPKL